MSNNEKQKEKEVEEQQADQFDEVDQPETEQEEGKEKSEEAEVKTDEDSDKVIADRPDDFTELSAEEKFDILQQENSELREEVESLAEEKEQFRSKYQRLRADFDNFRKRTNKEKKGFALKGQIELLEELLPVIDNFERALENEDEDDGEDFREGMEMIYKQLKNTLQQQGLERIESEGQPFDHKYHEAIMQLEAEDVESGTVVEELQKGYLFNGKVIRPAMVKVAE